MRISRLKVRISTIIKTFDNPLNPLGVALIEDSIIIDCAELAFSLNVWRSSLDSVVGFFPRLVRSPIYLTWILLHVMFDFIIFLMQSQRWIIRIPTRACLRALERCIFSNAAKGTNNAPEIYESEYFDTFLCNSVLVTTLMVIFYWCIIHQYSFQHTEW